MALFAESFVIKVNVPYSEYWLPLLIGMGVGVCALVVGKLVFGRRALIANVPAAAGPQPKAEDAFDPFTTGSPTEQRKSYRRQGNPIEVYVAFPEQKERPRRGWVLDRSMGGLCLQTSDELKPGELLSVLPISAPNMTPWVDIEVRTCRNVQDGFELGCQFIKTPAWSILLLFG